MAASSLPPSSSSSMKRVFPFKYHEDERSSRARREEADADVLDGLYATIEDFLNTVFDAGDRTFFYPWATLPFVDLYRASYNHVLQGELKVLKDVAGTIVGIGGGRGKGVLIVDDLVDTGKTAKVVREILPEAHFATVYAKPMGRPMVDTFITEVSQDTWIYFPWDTGLAFVPPIRDGEL